MPKLPARLSTDLSLGAQRIAWLLDHIWAGCQSAMARDIGVSQPVISRVVRGVQEPSSLLLGVLRKVPRINWDWLQHGDGEPLAEDVDIASSLPVFDRLVTADQLAASRLLSVERMPAARMLLSAARYFLRLGPSDDVVKRGAFRLQAGDLLLMHAFAQTPTQAELPPGAFCAIRGTDDSIVLAKLQSGFDGGPAAINWIPDSSSTSGTPERKGRGIRFDDIGGAAPTPSTGLAGRRLAEVVVAVSVVLMRTKF